MRRFVLTVAASTFAALVLLGGVGFLVVRSAIDARVAEATGFGAPWAADVPAEIRELHNLPPAERFGHFQGGQFRFSDTNSTPHVVNVTPGSVSSVKSDEVTIAANEGGSKTYSLNADTRIRTAGAPWAGGQSATLKAGDKVVVITLDGSNTAKAVMVGGADGFKPRGGPFHRG